MVVTPAEATATDFNTPMRKRSSVDNCTCQVPFGGRPADQTCVSALGAGLFAVSTGAQADAPAEAVVWAFRSRIAVIISAFSGSWASQSKTGWAACSKAAT